MAEAMSTTSVYKAIRGYLLCLLTLSNITVSDESCFIQMNIHRFVKKIMADAMRSCPLPTKDQREQCTDAQGL